MTLSSFDGMSAKTWTEAFSEFFFERFQRPLKAVISFAFVRLILKRSTSIFIIEKF